MNRHQPEGPGYDSAALDALLDSAMSGILAKLEAGFDPAAGLADIRARLGAAGDAGQLPTSARSIATDPPGRR
ncbi:MAG TPA: hypothetical protein VMV92_06615 [Streptosporangiaceae bacterium]|nr:hypothetical protein [Streptosporangiaceae bacterium]